MDTAHLSMKILHEQAIAARAATDDDQPAEILHLGQDFWYLHLDESGLTRSTNVNDTTPARIVADPKTATRMRDERADAERDGHTYGWIIGITADNVPIHIHMPTTHHPSPQ